MLDVQWNTINGRHLQTIFVNDYILFICNFRLQTFAESTDGEMLAQLYSVNFDAFFFLLVLSLFPRQYCTSIECECDGTRPIKI